MKLISDKIATALDNLTGLCFVGNRIFDRAHTVLDVNYIMPHSADVVHTYMAHKFPLLADLITEYCSDRGYAQNYPMTPEDYSNYSNIDEIFNKLLDYTRDLEKLATYTIGIAENENDQVTKKFLTDFVLEASKYTMMALKLVDFAEANKGDNRNMDFDARVKSYLKIEELEGDAAL